MTEAQQRHLDSALAADRPVPIPAGTARVLEQLGYVRQAGGGFAATERARDHAALVARGRMFRDLDRQLTPEARAFGDRVVCLMLAFKQFKPAQHFEAPRYRFTDGKYKHIAHVAACDFDGLEPAMPPGRWSAETIERITSQARGAARIVREFDTTRAQSAGATVTVDFAVDRTTPRSRFDAAEFAKRDDGTVNIAAYRARRPKPASRPTDGAA